ncbi:unnamed protein product [Owenia fusiformis]|uniref:Uncharacterized protein n=1 Tax=Owenia fusiformis TaxID=6347 RepID=A0A8J1TYC4_OWEFU|nr:unnamed protein product [Owenia fusiformis]
MLRQKETGEATKKHITYSKMGSTEINMTTFWKIFKTIVLFFGSAVMGIYCSMIGPLLPDLKIMVNADYEEIARVVSARSPPFLLSTLMGGLLSDSYRRYVGLILFIAQLVAVIGLVFTPWCRVLWLLGIMFFLQGTGAGPFTSGGNAWIVWLWGADSDAPVHSFHFGWGLGAFLAPQLTKPFVSETFTWRNETRNNSRIETTNSSDGDDGNYTFTFTTEGHPLYPYSIMACVTFVYSLLCLMLYFQERNEFMNNKTREIEMDQKDTSDKENNTTREDQIGHERSDKAMHRIKQALSPSSCGRGETAFGIQMSILVFTYHFLIVAGERSWGQYLYSYSKESNLGFTSADSSDLHSAFWLCFLIGRGVATLISKWCPPNIMVTGELFALLACSIVLFSFPHSVLVLWVASCAFGFFVAPLFPGGISIYNQYMDVTAMVLALSQGGAGLGAMLWNWITG